MLKDKQKISDEFLKMLFFKILMSHMTPLTMNPQKKHGEIVKIEDIDFSTFKNDYLGMTTKFSRWQRFKWFIGIGKMFEEIKTTPDNEPLDNPKLKNMTNKQHITKEQWNELNNIQ